MSEQKQKKRFTFVEARITSTLSVSLVLFILGIMATLGLLANSLSVYVRENIGFTIILKDDASDKDITKLNTALEEARYVNSILYISKEDALQEVIAELGENPEEIIGLNPMQASFEVKLKADYAHSDSLALIDKDLSAIKCIDEVYYQKDLIQSVNQNIQRAGVILLGLAIILMIISYVLISNTIRLMAYSRRFIIYTMKLVGATPGFIRRPFIVSNIICGIIAAIIAIIMLTASVSYISQEFGGFHSLVDTSMLLSVYGIVILLGIILTAIASFFAVNRYIGMKRDDLYYV